MIKVLIVDDEYIMRQGLKYMIDWEQEGFEIVGEATNGAEALQCIETLTPQIIICDIVMPQLDGVDFSEAVHRMYPRIQTIIVSGYDKYEYVRHTLINGVVDYILKPTLNPEELRRVLQKAVDRIPGARMGSTSGEVHYEHLVERYLLGHDNEWNSFHENLQNITDAIDSSWAFRLYLTEGDQFDNVRTFQNIYQMEKDLEQSKASDLERLNILVMGIGGKHYLSRTETITATDQEILNNICLWKEPRKYRNWQLPITICWMTCKIISMN